MKFIGDLMSAVMDSESRKPVERFWSAPTPTNAQTRLCTLWHPDLPGTCGTGPTLDDAHEALDDSRLGWLEAALDSGELIPEPWSYRQVSSPWLNSYAA